jgi:hypothetical protein
VIAMNLSGSLESFGLDEVLTLLGMSGRTARVQVSSPSGIGAIQLVDGAVSSASADVTRAGLLRQLVAAAAVPAADLARALEAAAPVRDLVDSGVVERGTAHDVAAEHCTEALGELLAWRSGEFAVWVGADDPADVGLRLPVHEAVQRGRDRVAEWERVREGLPTPDSVLALAPTLTGPTKLAVEDWSVLARVDGRRTLAEVLAVVGVAPLAASDRIVDLLGRGLLQVRRVDADAGPDEVTRMLDEFDGPEPADRAEVPDALLAPVLVEGPVAAAGVAPAVAASDQADVSWEAPADRAPYLPVVDTGDTAGLAPQDPVSGASESVGVAEPVGLQPEVFAAEPVDFEAALAVEAEPVGFAVDPFAVAEPVAFEDPVAIAVDAVALDEPVAFEAEPVAFDPEPVVLAEPLVAFEAEPVGFAHEPVVPFAVEPVWGDPVEVAPRSEAPASAAGVEWSPWAQALGLSAPAPEGELVVDPLAGPGIAEMIADAHGLLDTEYVPVPLAPVVEAPGPEHPAWSPAASMDGAQAEVVAAVPAPRVAAEQGWPVTTAQGAVPAHEAPDASTAAETAGQPEPAQPPLPTGPAADPLAGGLLSQLIANVRGL